jgi:alpha-tubulin suppressor-like RCC1 family protein
MLTGFPERIRVVLGTRFTGGTRFHGLNSGDVLILTKVPGSDPDTGDWTEDGTAISSGTNRLKFSPTHTSAEGGRAIILGQYNNSSSSSGWSEGSTAGFRGIVQTVSVGSNYNFKDIWNLAPANCSLKLSYTTLTNLSYNGDLFSALDEAGPAPVIDVQPVAVTKIEGETATFSVTAHGTGTLTYQWFKGSMLIAGAISSSYTTASLSVFDAGNYSVRVSDDNGPIRSDPALLTVTPIEKEISNFARLSLPGLVWATGGNDVGQLGDNTNDDKSSPVTIARTASYIAIANNGLSDASYFIDTNGMVWATGSGYRGRLGNNATDDFSSPVAIARQGSYVAVAAGSQFAIAIEASGMVFTWGYNNSGQLGDDTQDIKSSPVAIARIGIYTAISAGESHVLSIDSEGAVWVWGLNNFGQLGNDTNDNYRSPVSIARPSVYAAVSAGRNWSVFLDALNGMIYTCGINSNGELGHNNDTHCSSPIAIVRPGSYSAIAAGYSHVLAIDASTGMIWAWGANDGGCLGIGVGDGQSSPVSIARPGSYITISAGYNCSLAIEHDGTVWAWGSNSRGQLGTNSVDDYNSPVSIARISTYSVVAAGYTSSLFLESLQGGAEIPVANFTADIVSGTTPLTVTFSDTSTGTPTSWTWDFGDTGTSTNQNPQHVYSTPGTYTVGLTATNAEGSDTDTKTAYITVTGAPTPSPAHGSDNRSPSNTIGMGGTFDETPYPILKDTQMGGGISGDVTQENLPRLIGITLQDEQSGSSDGDKTDNSSGVNQGKRVFQSQSFIGMNSPS